MKHIFPILVVLIIYPFILVAQQADSTHISDTTILQNDSLKAGIEKDTVMQLVAERPLLQLQNKYLNSKAGPVSFSVEFRKAIRKDTLFYLVAGIVLLLAFFKYFYSRYFANLFRVFFNTSLRQSQLTDQLLQAKLPSLLYNIFFVISGGVYAYLLLIYYQLIKEGNMWLLVAASAAVIGVVYFIKFCTLKFTGWITGLSDMTNTYLFVIFLINKMIGIFLVPFIVVLAFSDNVLVKTGVLVSLLSIGFLLVLRFFRSYGLLQNQLKVSRFHFILYITGIEIIPLLVIYKGLMLYLSKNL